MGKYQKPPYYGTLKEAGREEDLRLAGENQSPKKWVEAGMNYGSWGLIDRSGKSSQTTYVPRGTTDSIIIIKRATPIRSIYKLVIYLRLVLSYRDTFLKVFEKNL